MSKSDVKIESALKSSNDLSNAEAASILEAMYSSMSRETNIKKETMKPFLLFAQQRTELTNDTISYLQSFSGEQISLGCVSYVANFSNETNKQDEIVEIVAQWEKKKSGLQSAIEKLMKK